MSILSFKYQYLDYQKLNGDCTVLIDTDQAQFNGSRSVTIAGAPVTMYEIYANGHIYGSTTDNPDPNTCCDGSNVYQNAPAVTYPTEDISDYEVLVHVPGTPQDPDGEIKKIPVSELLTNPYGYVAYVSKQYSGAAAATVTGLTAANISSTNADYNKQRSNALFNSEMYPFPDPWSARNALLDAIAAGKITRGVIVIKGGEQFTVGSDDPTKNGDANGVAANNTAADICFSSTNNAVPASLIQDKLAVHFESGSMIKYINKSYVIFPFYCLGTTAYNSAVTGYGTIEEVYGGLQGFDQTLFYCDNAYANISVTLSNFAINTGSHFYFYGFKSINITIENYSSAGGTPFRVCPFARQTANGDGTPCLLNVRIKNLYCGINFKYPNDTGRNPLIFKLGGLNVARQKALNFFIDNLVTEAFRTNIADTDSLGSDGTTDYLNVAFNCEIANSVIRKTVVDSRNDLGGIGGQNTSKDSVFSFIFKNMMTDTALIAYETWFSTYGTSVSSNSKLLIKVDNCYKRSNNDPDPLFKLNSAGPVQTSTNCIRIIEGNYQVDPACSMILYSGVSKSNRFNIKGTYIIRGAKPVLSIADTASRITLQDCVFVNDTTVPAITASVAAQLNCKDVVVTSANHANVTVLGDAVRINANLINYL